MTKHKKHHRIIATIFLLIFFPTLVPNNLFASNNGPKSPEAASFEPVDATDMVNLITGQYSYVLPLLNVPSPEGGYPLAMGYHAGIALDQEASWTGLGWNVNPGAIDRGINGYPDDYNASHLNEYFYDTGGEEYQSFVSASWSGYGAVSVGVGFNWGSNQALGGSVSVGYGFDAGGGTKIGANVSIGFGSSSGQDSIGVGVRTSSGLTVGMNINSDGNAGISAGYSTEGTADTNSQGFSIGYNTSGSLSFKAHSGSTDISLSSSSSGTNVETPIGVGYSSTFNNTMNSGDYATESTSWMIPLAVPTPWGVFSLSFGKQTFSYHLSLNENNYATGPIYFEKGVKDITKQVWRCIPHSDECSWRTITVGKAFMDINETPIINKELGTSTDVAINNITFPNYDNYNVQAQGLSGSMSSTLHENGALFGLSGKKNDQGYSLNYAIGGGTGTPDYAKFDSRPNFYLDNEISTFINVLSTNFNSNTTNKDILAHYTDGVELPAKLRKKTATFIEYFTNNDIITNYAGLKQKGYLQVNVSGFDRSTMPKDGIGAFQVTAIDGKTYHYSLPVYNHETITRTFGSVLKSPLESQSYFEKRQLEPFATHWLLTAVTGPDFVDNGDGVAGKGDLGYWTSFEYGKWTDAFVWKAPFKKDYITDDSNSNVKTWIRGRKQLYYLDKVKTRTHTALFIKSERVDAPSENWSYKSVDQSGIIQHEDSYNEKFSVPSQNQLRLDKIILLKNEDDVVDKNYGSDLNLSTVITYASSDKESEIAKYNIKDNILDNNDNWSTCIAKAVKVIDFNYDTSLVPGDNRLTLKSVNFNGKSGTSVLPPYKFDYINDTNTFNIDDKDGWGYLADKPEAFSLNKIETPQGGIINVNYEKNIFKTIVPFVLEYKNVNTKYKCSISESANSNDINVTLTNGTNDFLDFPIGKIVDVNLSVTRSRNHIDAYIKSYKGLGVISSSNNGVYEVKLSDPVVKINLPSPTDSYYFENCFVKIETDNNSIFKSGGIRVNNLVVSDGINNYITDYKYGQNEDGVGYVSYVPYSQNVAKEVPYSAELPAPRVMYEYVTMSSHKEGFASEGKIRYKFNVMKSKDANKTKYGDFYEIIENKQAPVTNSSNIDVNISAFTVKDNLASIGQLLEVATFNSQGQQLSKISNTYYGMDEVPNNMGVSQESYQTYKTVDYLTNTSSIKDKWIINSSTRIKYPNIIKSSTEQKNGYIYTTNFLDYDLISGVAKETRSVSSDGQSLRTKTIPAYVKYSGMGSKVDNINNKNMLSQTAANYSYILVDKANDIWKETGVGITTWSNIWSYKDIAGTTTTPTASDKKIWRKHKSYVWNGVKDNNGIFLGTLDSNGVLQNFNNGNDDSFDWAVPVGVGVPVTQPSQWKQTSEVTLYDHYSAPLEMKDINGNFASTKMGDNDTKVMATGNAGYSEMFFSGVENNAGTSWSEPEVKTNNFTTSIYFHTGKSSIATTSNSEFGASMKSGEHRAGKYKLSVWVHKTNVGKACVRINVGSAPIPFNGETVTAGDWVLKTHYFDVTSSAVYPFVNSIDPTTVIYDDLMIRPVASTITGYVYNEWDELTYIIGNNGLATRFEYDAAGRLIKTSSEVINDAANGIVGGFKVVKTNIYNNRYLN